MIKYKASILNEWDQNFFNKKIQKNSKKNNKKKRVIVKYKWKVKDESVNKIKSIKSSKIKKRYKHVNAVALEVDEKDIEMIKADINVSEVYEDFRVHTLLNESSQQIDANQVHIEWVTWKNVNVCIIDTGIDKSHPALSQPVAEYDFVNNDNDASDDNGHWTHVAWIIASKDETYKWISSDASLMIAKSLDSEGSWWSSDIISGVEWCMNAWADVINLSLGWWAYNSDCDSELLAQVSNSAVEQGIVVVAASWNDWYANAISAPACASKVMAIGAVDKNDWRTSYWNEGSELDVVAPWSNIVSVQLGGGFVAKWGTSMATPHSAWVVALLLESNWLLNPTNIRDILRDSAVDLWTTWFDTIYWYWRIDALWAYQDTLIPTTNPEEIFFEDFQSWLWNNWNESNEFDWTTEKPAERQVPWKSSSNLVAHADRCSSSKGCIMTLKNSIDLTSFESVNLDFWRYIDKWLDSWEFLKVEAFDWNSWNEIFYWTHWQGDDDIWHQESIDLSAYLVSNFNLRFTSRESSSREKTELDDILITWITSTWNKTPIANAGQDQIVNDSDWTLEETVILDWTASNDPDGSITNYEWKDWIDILWNTATLNTSLSVGVHTVELTVTDNEGVQNTDSVVITINANNSPTANAGQDQNIMDSDDNGTEQVTLDGNSSSDTDWTITSYVWKEGATIIWTWAIISHNFTIWTHTITLVATDNWNAIDSDKVIITINPYINQAPTSNAWDDQSILLGQTANFNASLSNDPDWNIVSYNWNFGDGSTATWVEVSHVYQSAWNFIATLIVVDNWGLSSTDTVNVIVSEESQIDIQITSILTKDIKPRDRYEVKAYILNNETQSQDIIAQIEILDPNWNPVSWKGLSDKNASISWWDTKEIKWRNITPRSSILGTYTANVTVLQSWEVLDSSSKTFVMYK